MLLLLPAAPAPPADPLAAAKQPSAAPLDFNPFGGPAAAAASPVPMTLLPSDRASQEGHSCQEQGEASSCCTAHLKIRSL